LEQLNQPQTSAKANEVYISVEEALAAAFHGPKWLAGNWKKHVKQLSKYYKVSSRIQSSTGDNGDW